MIEEFYITSEMIDEIISMFSEEDGYECRYDELNVFDVFFDGIFTAQIEVLDEDLYDVGVGVYGNDGTFYGYFFAKTVETLEDVKEIVDNFNSKF